jgi:hypothetical protein
VALSSAERQRNYRKRKREQSNATPSRPVTPSRPDIDPVVSLLEALPRVMPSHDGPYTYKDRARDFLAVFGGSSDAEQGRRVLAQIHQICDPAPLPRNADKPGTLAFQDGMRRVMREIMLCMVAKDPMTIQRSSDVDHA